MNPLLKRRNPKVPTSPARNLRRKRRTRRKKIRKRRTRKKMMMIHSLLQSRHHAAAVIAYAPTISLRTLPAVDASQLNAVLLLLVLLPYS